MKQKSPEAVEKYSVDLDKNRKRKSDNENMEDSENEEETKKVTFDTSWAENPKKAAKKRKRQLKKSNQKMEAVADDLEKALDLI